MMETTLWDLPRDKSAAIIRLTCAGEIRPRLTELGFTEGERVRKLLCSRGMAACLICGTLIALRKNDARGILVNTEE